MRKNSFITTYENIDYFKNDDNPYYLLLFLKDEDVATCKINKDCKEIDFLAFANTVNLKTIYFEGTKEAWLEIKKDPKLNHSTNHLTIICSDGDLEFLDTDMEVVNNYLGEGNDN